MDIYTATTVGSNQLIRSLEPVRHDSGVVVTFVWAYTDATDRWGALAAAITYVLIAYAIIRYQRSLQLRLSAWLTIAASAVMLIFAVDAAMRSENGRKNLVTRSTLIWVWVSLQAILVAAGIFQKKMLPCALLLLGPIGSRTYPTAFCPRLLRLLHPYSCTPVLLGRRHTPLA